VLSDKDWATRWEEQRRKGKARFMLRELVLGLSAGLVAAVLAAYISRTDSGTSIGTLGWAFPIFLLFAFWSLLHAWWSWRAAERRFRAITSHSDS